MHKIKAATPYLSGTHDRILKEAISSYHLLTARQITRLLYPTVKLGNLTTIQTRLKALTEAGYLTAAHLPTVQGVRPFVYCLSSKGRKVLREEGMEAVVSFEQAELERRSPGWYFHLLELNDFLISAAILEKTITPLHLESFEHDFTIAQSPPQARTIDNKVVRVSPDGFLHFTLHSGGKTRSARFLIELDRGTESDETLRKKIRAYLFCFDQEVLQSRFGGKVLTLLFPTTAGGKRLERLRSLAQATLKAYDNTLTAASYKNQMFKFAAVPPLQNDYLTPDTNLRSKMPF